MNALALAKRRAALRRREGGAVMFVVAMTLAVLASVGIYALAAAATEVRTSGNERQNTQTHYLAEYGVLGAAREMAGGRALLTVNRDDHGQNVPGHQLRVASGGAGDRACLGARLPADGVRSSANHRGIRRPRSSCPTPERRRMPRAPSPAASAPYR